VCNRDPLPGSVVVQEHVMSRLPSRVCPSGSPAAPLDRRGLRALKPALDRLYEDFNRLHSAADPVQFVHRYEHPADREVVAFCASALAFGRVASVLASIDALLHVMGPHPADFVRGFEPRHHGAALGRLVHRWTRGDDLAMLLVVLRGMLDTSGSIEAFFLAGDDGRAADLGAALDSFSCRALAFVPQGARGARPARPGVRYFFPQPSSGSACKRLNLFLRWMVRRDAIDVGVWTRLAPARLVVPLDTHVMRVGRCLRLTRYASPGWRMAAEITASLRQVDPSDPVRYDFSLCHLGMMNACGFSRDQGDAQCPLRGACRPAASRRPVSRPPSGPR
jgi:uncharacterized protein (TIGR02757 family)